MSKVREFSAMVYRVSSLVEQLNDVRQRLVEELGRLGDCPDHYADGDEDRQPDQNEHSDGELVGPAVEKVIHVVHPFVQCH